MASLRILAFDHEGRPVQFDTWLDDLQLYLLSDSKDSVSLFDLASSATPAPPVTADSATRSQWLTRDAAARLAIRNHLPLVKCAHFGQHRTAQALYAAVVARYSSRATAALGRLLLPYQFPELSAFATVEDLVSHLRTSDACYRATVPAEFLDRNQPPMFITLYFIVTCLPDSLRSVRDHFLSLDPTSLTVDLLEQHLLAAKTSAVALGAAGGTLRPPFFEGCSPSHLAPSYASAAVADGKGSKGGGGGSGSGAGGSSGGGGGSGGGGSGGSGGGSGGGSNGSGGNGGGGTGGSGTGARRGGPGGGERQQQQRRSETQSPEQLREWLVQRGTSGGSDSCPYVIRRGVRAGQTCGKLHTQHRCFSHLDDARRAEFGDDVELPRWADLLRSRIAIFDLDYDAILSAMYALSVTAEGDYYRCVPTDPGIAAAALGASESGTLPGTAPAQALHTFTLDSGASRCLFRESTTITPLPAPVLVRLADPSGGPVVARSSTVLPCLAVPSGSLSGLHLPSFSTNLVSTAALQDALVTTTTPGGQRVSICTCTRTGCHLATFTRWPRSSLYTLATEPSHVAASAQHSHLLVSGLPRSLPPLPPSPAPPCLPCVEGRQHAAPHSSSFPPTTAPLQTLHMDVWGPARVSGQSRERYFLLVVDDYTQYTTVFPLRSKGQVVDVLIPWIHTVRLQLRERLGQDLPVLRLHSIRGVMEVARTSMIHAAAPHFLWPFATSPTLHWTGEFGDASVFRVWGSRAFVRDTSADKLSARAIPCDFTFDEYGGAEPGGEEPGGAESEGAMSVGAEPRGAALSGGRAGASPYLSPQQLREWLVRRARLRSGAPGAQGAGDAGAGGAGVTATARGPGVTATAGTGGACTRGTGAAASGGIEARDPTEPGGAGAAGAGAVDPGARGAGGTVRPRPYFVPLLQQVLGVPSSTGLTPPLLCPPPYQSQPPLQPASPLLAPSPYTEQSDGLTKRREPASRPVSPVCTARRASRSRPPPVPGTHAMALRPSSVPLRVPLPAPRESSLLEVPDPESDRTRASSPTVSRLLAIIVTDPSFKSATAFALVAELLEFAAACRLDYATALVAKSASSSPPSVGGECALGTDVLEDRQEDFECLAAAVPRFTSMLLTPDAPDIPTPRSYAEAITGPYSSQWQAAMDAEMASWKSTVTYVDKVSPPGVNIVDGMWIFTVKRPPGSSSAFKARYVAQGFSQRHGVDYFQTFSPTPKMSTLRVLLHVAAQRDYELHSLDFSTAFLQGSLHEEIWPRRPPGFSESFLAGPSAPPLGPLATATAAPAAIAAPESCATMASLRALVFDPEGRPVAFDTWHDDLQLYLLSDLKDNVSLFDHVSGAAPAPPATADVSTRSQWQSRDATTSLAIRNHLPPPMFITLYFIVTRLPDSLRSVRDNFLTLDPTSLTVDLLKQHLLAAETSAFAVGAACGTPRPPFFEGCSPSPLSPSFASVAAADVSVPEDVGAASTSAKCRNSKGKGGRGSGGGSVGGGGSSGSGSGGSGRGGGGSGGGGGGGTGGGGGGSSGGGGDSGGSGGSGGGGTSGGRSGPRRGGPGGGRGQQQQRRSETQTPQQLREWLVQRGTGEGSETCPYVLRTGVHTGQTCGRFHNERRCFARLDDTWRAEFGIAAAALGASASGTPPSTVPAAALHTFTLDSGASRCFFRESTTLTPLPAPVPVRLADPSESPVFACSSTVLPCPANPSGSLSSLHLPLFSTNLVSTTALQDAMLTTTTPGGQRVSICTCTRTGRHLATFTRRPGLSLYTLATEPPQVVASAQVSASGQVAASFLCRLLSHQTLLWHHRLGHPSLPRLRGMHSRLLVSGLPRSLSPLPPSPAPPCLPCVEGRQRAAPHSSSFPPTTAPLQTLHMDVWGPACVSGQGRGRYFLLVVDGYTRYTSVFPLHSKGEVSNVLIPWIRTVRLQLRERFGQDLPVLRLHSDRGGEFSSDLLRDFCHGEGITQSFTLPDSPQKNGIAQRRIGLVMEVTRTSMIHAATPHFLWPFVVRYAAHQLNLWPRTSSPPAPGGAEPGGAEPEGVEPGGAESEGAESGGAEPRGAASSGGPAGASPRLSSQQLREWLVRRAHRRSGAPGAGGAGGTGVGGTAVSTGAGGTGGTAATSPGGARTSGAGAAGTSGVGCAGAGDPTEPGAAGTGGAGAGVDGVGGPGAGGVGAAGAGVGGTGAGGAGAAGAGAVDPGAGGAGGTMRPRSYFVPLLQHVLGVPSSTGLPPPFVCPPPDQSQPPLQPASPLPAPSPYTEQSGGLIERREPASHPISPVRSARRAPRLCPPLVPRTHTMALQCTACPIVARLLATAVTDPSFESAAASALFAELLDFAAACRLDYATALVAESESASPPSIGGECALGTDVLEDRQEDFEHLAVAVPRFASMLLAPEGDSDAPDIPTLRSYAEANTGPYSSQWPAAMDAEMASWNQRQGVDYFQTFSPTPKITTLRVLLHIAAQRDYELHSLDFSTAFLQGSLHEEIWLHYPPGFTGSFPTGTQWSLRRPVYGLRLAPREWHVTLRTTLAALGFTPSTADPSLFLRTDTSLPPFCILVYVDDLVFANADTEALTLLKSELQKRHTCTDVG
ncbi:unnamed protein product [Closterium sp. NIES-54]